MLTDCCSCYKCVCVCYAQLGGFEATAAVRQWEHQHQPDQRIPIVAMTAHALAGFREQCIAAGISLFFADDDVFWLSLLAMFSF